MFRALILGAPASGKGTISSRIVNYFDMQHLSSGDLLRNQIKQGSNIGLEAKAYVTKGKLVPDHVITKLLLSELSKIGNKSWLLDGFPRTRSQAEALASEHKLHMVIALEVPFEVIIERVKGRWIHLASGRVYNDTFNQPKIKGKDDVTGEPLVQRLDDSPEAVKRRLELYRQTISPLLEFYAERQVLQRFSGRTSDEIWPKVKESLVNYGLPSQH